MNLRENKDTGAGVKPVTMPAASVSAESRKRSADSGETSGESKKHCWGILTSQGSWADRSPLHEAASQGRLLALRTLLSQGYPANIVTIDHVTPLHEAALSGHVACVRALINAGANVNARTIDGVSPLFNSCASGSAVCVELLLQHGATAHNSHAHHPSALHEACKRGSLSCLESLLSRGVDPDYEVPHLGSALYVSCLHKHSECTRVLLHKGASVNRGLAEATPLHAASASDSEQQVALLLDFGADVNLKDSNNLKAVEVAPPEGRVAKLLRHHHGCPRALADLCRIHIRALIGRSRLKLLPQLPLPPLLTDFLDHT